jgi:hypothetical protein
MAISVKSFAMVVVAVVLVVVVCVVLVARSFASNDKHGDR